MPVTKSTRECYEIREISRAEWANITLTTWQRIANIGTKHEHTNYGGEIVIHSSYGTWGNIWSACGVPFKEFLQHVEFDYAFGKFMGSDLNAFDGEKSLRELRRKIIDDRKHTELTREGARALWDSLDGYSFYATASPSDCVTYLSEIREDLLSDDHRDAAELIASLGKKSRNHHARAP